MFADVGGVPGIFMGRGEKDDHGWQGMWIFALVIVFIILAVFMRRDERDKPYVQQPAYPAYPPYPVGGGAVYAENETLSHREHWDQVRDTLKSETKQVETTMRGNFDLARQADYNHYTAAMQSERHNNETNRNVDMLRAENERQTLLLMREMDQKEAACLRERLLKEEFEKSNLMQTMAIVNAVRPYPVPVNQIWGQTPIPAHPHVNPVCG